MTDMIKDWLRSGKFIPVEGIELSPLSSEEWPAIPLCYRSKRSEVYFMRDVNDQVWIIKKFLTNEEARTGYRSSIQPLIPHRPGFEAGYLRKVLNRASVSNACSHNLRISEWLEHSILMPALSGHRWDRMSISVSEGKQFFPRKQRIRLVSKLSEKVKWLESQNISHRELSSMSIYIDERGADVSLVDWDNIFHPTLPMPEDLRRGTNGYIAPFLPMKGDSGARNTWRPRADRFSLSLLNSEILSVQASLPVTGERSCCDQDEIYNLGGNCLTAMADMLTAQFPKAAILLKQSLAAKSFDECPAPAEWIAAMGGEPAINPKQIPIRNRATFVSLNRDSLAKLNKSAFVKLNRNLFVKPPTGKTP